MIQPAASSARVDNSHMRALLLAPAFAVSLFAQAQLDWHDIKSLELRGQGWKDTKSPFDRLPAKAEGVVRQPVWNLSLDSTGLYVAFTTDAKQIRARWTLRKEKLALPHMPATGVSGLDLYSRWNGQWMWLANGRPEKQTNEQDMVSNYSGPAREYMLYLPLYNGITSLEIGVPQGASITPLPAPQSKPVVFYGTSILQGGCASRPGMAYPSIVGRMLNWPTINLGFSGNGQSEPEVAKLLAELDPAAYVLDSLPNLDAAKVRERVEPFIKTLRATHPTTPILLVENVVYTNSEFVPAREQNYKDKNAALSEIFVKLRDAGDKNLYYIPGGDLLGTDGEGTVDGAHPSDLGFLRMAEQISPYVRRVLPYPRGFFNRAN